MTDDQLQKLPEPSPDFTRVSPRVRWWWWASQAWTEFCNGVMNALDIVGGVGVTSAAFNAPDYTVSAMADTAAPITIITVLMLGLREFNIWRRSHPMPNPFFNAEP